MIALCLGSATNVWADYEAAKALVGPDHLVVVCNFTGVQFEGRIDAWATLHRERLNQWRMERAAKGWNTDFRAFIHDAQAGVVGEVEPQVWNGSSGIYTAQVALRRLGATGAILCGVPMEAEAGHIHWGGEWAALERYRRGVEAAKADGAPIRSMSGWTAEVLGKPDAEWIGSLPKGERPPALTVEEDAMWIRMRATHNFVPPEERRVAVKYLRDGVYLVKRAWGEAMVAEGVAKEVRAPRKPAAEEADGGRG